MNGEGNFEKMLGSEGYATPKEIEEARLFIMGIFVKEKIEKSEILPITGNFSTMYAGAAIEMRKKS